MTYSEIYEIKIISEIIEELIEFRGLICNSEHTGKNILNSGLSSSSAGKISINTLLSLWDNNYWIEYGTDNNKYWIYQIDKNMYKMFSKSGIILKKENPRKYLIQFLKHPYTIPYNGSIVNINELNALYEKEKNRVKL